MRYIWFIPIPPGLLPHVATLLIVLGGFAFVIQQRALGASLVVSAIVLMVLPAFDPAIEAGVDTAIDVGAHYVQQWSWWVTAGVFLVVALLLFRAIVGFIFNRDVADRATATLIAGGVQGVFRVLFVGPFLILGVLPWPVRWAVITAVACALAYIFWGPGWAQLVSWML